MRVIKPNKYPENPFVVLRTKAGLRQEDVAEKLGVDRSAIAAWETGRSFPRLGKLEAIAALYNCDVTDIIKLAQE